MTEWNAATIKAGREARSWTQQQLADAVGVSRRAVVSWEAGEASPQGRYAAQLERVFAAEEKSADPSDTPLLLRDADFAQTLQHLADLYRDRHIRPIHVDTEPAARAIEALQVDLAVMEIEKGKAPQ